MESHCVSKWLQWASEWPKRALIRNTIGAQRSGFYCRLENRLPRLTLGPALKIAEPKVRTCESMHDEQVQLPSLGAECTWSMTSRVSSSAPERRSPCTAPSRTDRDHQFVIPSNAISYARINAQRLAKLAVTVAGWRGWRGWRGLPELSTANAVQRASARARDF